MSEITPRAVRELFRGVLRGSDRVPSLEVCAEVATWLEYLRVRRAAPARPNGVATRRAWRAGAALAGELAQLEQAMPDVPPDAEVPAAPWLEAVVRRVAEDAARLRAARRAVERVLPMLEPGPKEGVAWHIEAEGLARIFVAAMARANPGRAYGVSHEGPLARFVRAALLLAVGEERTEEAICKWLQRRRLSRSRAAAGVSAIAAPGRRAVSG